MQETIACDVHFASIDRCSCPDGPIRVLSVIPSDGSVNSMVFAHKQVSALQNAGVSCDIFLFPTTRSIWTLFKEWLRFRRTIRSLRPDVIHAHYGTLTAFFSAFGTMVPLVITYRGSDLNPDATASRFACFCRRLLSELAALRANKIICVSDQLRDRLWWKQSSAFVVPTGADSGIFHPRSRSECRARIGWNNSERVVLFNAGPIPQIKRLDIAERAVEVARKICGDIRFVTLDGNVAPVDVAVMMSAADCLLLTSDWEGSPTVVQEAILCGLPVVSVDVGDVRQQLTGVWPSRIVSRNPEEIGAAVAEILSQNLRSNGWNRARHLAHSEISKQVIKLYRAAMRSTGVHTHGTSHS